MLAHALYLDLVYIRLKSTLDGSEIEVAHAGSGRLDTGRAREVGTVLERLLNRDEAGSPVTIGSPVGNDVLRAMVMPVGATGSHG